MSFIRPEHRHPEKRWQLQLICCGFDAGTDGSDTWDEADALRRSYVQAEGHDRAAILTDTAEVPR